MIYKIINERAKVPNKEIIIQADTRNRSNHGHKLRIMSNNTNQYKFSFFTSTISLSNCLPKALVDSETLHPNRIGHTCIWVANLVKNKKEPRVDKPLSRSSSDEPRFDYSNLSRTNEPRFDYPPT